VLYSVGYVDFERPEGAEKAIEDVRKRFTCVLEVVKMSCWSLNLPVYF